MGFDIYGNGSIIAILNFKKICKIFKVNVNTDTDDIIKLMRKDLNFRDYKFKYKCVKCDKKIKLRCCFENCFCCFCVKCEICTDKHSIYDLTYKCKCGGDMYNECDKCHMEWSCDKCKMCYRCYYIENGERKEKKKRKKIPTSLYITINSCSPGEYKEYNAKGYTDVDTSTIDKLVKKYNADILLKVSYSMC